MSEDSLFREVDEEVRRDQFAKLWQRYGSYVVAVSLLVILAVAGIKGWQYWQTRQAEAGGAAYQQALNQLEQGKAAEAQLSFAEIASGSHKGYATLARLQLAAALAERGETAEAVAAYDKVADDGSVDQELRDLARVRAGYLLAGTANAEELEVRLRPLDRPNSPWTNAVREIRAIAAYRAGDFGLADRLMNEILVDPQAPQGMRQRAQIMVQLLQPVLPGKTAAAD